MTEATTLNEEELKSLLAELSTMFVDNYIKALNEAMVEIGNAQQLPPEEITAAALIRAAEQNADLAAYYAEVLGIGASAELQQALNGWRDTTASQAQAMAHPSRTAMDVVNQWVIEGTLALELEPIAGAASLGKLIGFAGKIKTGLGLLEALIEGDMPEVAGIAGGFAFGAIVAGGVIAALTAISAPVVVVVAVGTAVGFAAGWAVETSLNYVLDYATGRDSEDEEERQEALDDARALIFNNSRRSLPGTDHLIYFGDGDDNVQTGTAGRRNAMVGAGGNDIFFGANLDDFLGGGQGNDVMEGAEGNDILDGGAGDDFLQGGSGSDTLRGGSGFDTYRYETGDFARGNFDTITDRDGVGVITFNGLNIGGTDFSPPYRTESTWLSSDNVFRFMLSGSGDDQALIIVHRATNSRIRVENWQNGQFGITLDMTPPAGFADAHYEPGVGGHNIIYVAANQGAVQGTNGNDIISSTAGEVVMDAPDEQWLAENLAQWGAAIVDHGSNWYTRTRDGSAYNPLVHIGDQSLITFFLSDNEDYTPAYLDENQVDSDDRIHAGAGNDVVDSGAGDDTIDGGTGDDGLRAGAGDDLLDGSYGEDILVGGTGDDTLDGGWDSDDLYGGEGEDMLNGGQGDDSLAGEDGADALAGGDENDTLLGGDGDDTLHGDTGNDHLQGDDGGDSLVGGEGADTLMGVDGEDELDGGAGDDILNGGDGDDYLRGGSGADQLTGGAGADDIRGEDGDDVIQGDILDAPANEHGDDTINGGQGNDTIHGQGGDDRIIGGEGDDVIGGDSETLATADHGDDVLHGDSGNDQLFGMGGDDTLDGGTGNDTLAGDEAGDQVGNDLLIGGDGFDMLVGRAGNDTLFGDAGDDQLDGGTGDDSLFGGDGNDGIYADSGNDTVSGGRGSDNINGFTGDDSLDGGADTDYVFGGEGNDVVLGGEGNDWLYGEAGNDTLDGGGGSDTLYGGGGDNTYRWGYAQGNDRIRNSGTSTGNSVLELDASIHPADIRVRVFNDDLVIEIIGTSMQMVVEGFGRTDGTAPIGRIEFADGTVWTAATIMSQLFTGTWQADLISGFSLGDAIDAGGGNDSVYGGGGNDTILGGSGHDLVRGDAGNDSLNGGDGYDTVWGGDGDDTIDGGAGNDLIGGMAGNDVLVSALGGGNDTISGGAGDTLRVLDALPANATLARSGNDLLVALADGRQLRITDHFTTDTLAGIQFGVGGTTWNAADILSRVGPPTIANTMTGTAGNDTFVVDNTLDVINEQANGGVDTVQASTDYTLGANLENLVLTGTFGWTGVGNALDNQITGNAGSNILDGAGGTDTLIGGAGDDTFYNGEVIVENAGGGYDTQYVTAGGATMAANVERMIVNASSASIFGATYTGNALDNVIEVQNTPVATTIDGGLGADRMIYGGWQDVTFVVDNAGDVIEMNGRGLVYIHSSLAGAYTIGNYVGGGFKAIAAVAMQITGNAYGTQFDMRAAAAGSSAAGGGGDDYYLYVDGMQIIEAADGGTNDRMEYHTANGAATIAANVERLILASYAQNASATGNADANVLGGNSYRNALNGLGGNDTLFGNAGEDTLDGGAGDDLMMGGEDSDTYIVDSLGDVVEETGQWGWDTVIASVDFTLGATLENLRMSAGGVTGTGNDIHNGMWASSAGNRLLGMGGDDELYGASGNDTLDGGDGNDTLRAGTGNDVLDGGAGADVVDGEAGNDTLSGDAGDTLIGGDGDDVFVYELGDGSLALRDNGANDVLRFGAGIAAADVQFLNDSSTGRFVLRIGADTIDLDGWPAVDFIEFADGTRWDVAALINYAPTVWDGTLYEFQEGEVFVLDASQFFGDEDPATCTVQVLGGAPAWLTYDAASRTFRGTAPANSGNAFNVQIRVTDARGASSEGAISFQVINTIRGTAGNDSLVGTSARDILVGLAGNDTLNGGTGADRMIGGAGNDTYTIDNIDDFADEYTAAFDDAGGLDSVNVSINEYTMSEFIETLTLTGSSGLRAYGNDGANTMNGNTGANRLEGGAGNDLLDGKAGNDTLVGGEGDDIYVVADAGDVVTELDGEGTDTVRASRTYTLGNHLENLELTGTSALNGTGNTLANVLTGNSAVNNLSGGDGNDTLIGAAGNDTLGGGNHDDRLDGGTGNDSLTGGAGHDTYVMGRGYGTDTVVENGAASSNQDVAKFLSGVAYDQLWFKKVSNDLEITIIGTTDKLIIKGWFTGANCQVEQIRTTDGSWLLTAEKVQALVTKMATMTMPTGTTLTAAQRSALASTFAATWVQDLQGGMAMSFASVPTAIHEAGPAPMVVAPASGDAVPTDETTPVVVAPIDPGTGDGIDTGTPLPGIDIDVGSPQPGNGNGAPTPGNGSGIVVATPAPAIGSGMIAPVDPVEGQYVLQHLTGSAPRLRGGGEPGLRAHAPRLAAAIHKPADRSTTPGFVVDFDEGVDAGASRTNDGGQTTPGFVVDVGSGNEPGFLPGVVPLAREYDLLVGAMARFGIEETGCGHVDESGLRTVPVLVPPAH